MRWWTLPSLALVACASATAPASPRDAGPVPESEPESSPAAPEAASPGAVSPASSPVPVVSELDVLAGEFVRDAEDAGHEVAAGAVELLIPFTPRDTFKPGAEAMLADMVALAQAHPRLGFHVAAHTDSLGHQLYNRHLSLWRALAVARALVKGGVDCRRLLAIGYGETRPISHASRARLRRIELIPAALDEPPTAPRFAPLAHPVCPDAGEPPASGPRAHALARAFLEDGARAGFKSGLVTGALTLDGPTIARAGSSDLGRDPSARALHKLLVAHPRISVRIDVVDEGDQNTTRREWRAPGRAGPFVNWLIDQGIACRRLVAYDWGDPARDGPASTKIRVDGVDTPARYADGADALECDARDVTGGAP